MPFSEPFIHRDAREPGKFAGELHVREATRKQVINGTNRHAESRGQLAFSFKFRFVHRGRFCHRVICAHVAFLAGAFVALPVATIRLHPPEFEKDQRVATREKGGGVVN